MAFLRLSRSNTSATLSSGLVLSALEIFLSVAFKRSCIAASGSFTLLGRVDRHEAGSGKQEMSERKGMATCGQRVCLGLGMKSILAGHAINRAEFKDTSRTPGRNIVGRGRENKGSIATSAPLGLLLM